MSSSLDRDFQTEAEYLRQASLYVGRSEIEDAIALLERARLLVPVTNRLLNTLGKLYLTAGKPAQAARCFESVLNRKPKIEVYEDLPADEDMQYLAEQSHQLNEKEYSFEVSDEKINVVPVRKILSLGTKKAVQDKKIIFKNKPLLSVPEKPEDIHHLAVAT